MHTRLTEARRILPRVVRLRRQLHAHPELGLELPRTRAALLEELADLDLELRKGEKTSSLVGVLHGGRPGPALVLRADMDALALTEDSGVEFASTQPGRMHACGHDAHSAMLCGAARLLARHRTDLSGRVIFLFQAGEEGYFGARHVLEEGLLRDEATPDAVFALHVDPRLPVGITASRPGPLLASADVWSAELRGRGGHASMPHDACDPIPAACEVVQALQSFVTRRIDVFDPVVLTVTKIDAGTTNNVIPESAHLLGTLRSTSERSRQAAQQAIRRVITKVAQAHELEATIHVIPGYPVTRNHAGFTAFARETTLELLGENGFVDMPAPIMGAEDFSLLLERWPGAMLFLGACPAGEASPAPCHSNRMRIDEEALVFGMTLHTAMARAYLARTPRFSHD